MATFRLLRCHDPRCDVVWLVDQEAEGVRYMEGAVGAYWGTMRPLPSGRALCFGCRACATRIAELSREVRNLQIARDYIPADGPRAVGEDQAQAPSPTEDFPTWI